MRGKAVISWFHRLSNRITPAYAGKSTYSDATQSTHGDHPRLCGEKLPRLWCCIHQKGSPPPMRGKVSRCRRSFCISRITPAYAGKSCHNDDATFSNGDHPRLCGEKEFALFVHQLTSGSPPPMRGKGVINQTVPSSSRITPAYAGKSGGVYPAGVGERDHPRLCGEKFQLTF